MNRAKRRGSRKWSMRSAARGVTRSIVRKSQSIRRHSLGEPDRTWMQVRWLRSCAPLPAGAVARALVSPLKSLSLVLGAVFLLGTATCLAQGNSAPAAADSRVEHGKYLATAGNCVSCHTRPGGAPFTGGLAFETPLGTLYSTNITPDPETGIGRWTAADLRRAMHEGIARDGSQLLPAFPYTSFTKVSDADVA